MSTLPPAVVEAERIVIGAAMVDGRTLEQAADIVRAEHFACDLHRRSWTAILALTERGEDPSLPAVRREVERGGHALPQEQVVELAGMLDGLPRITDSSHWARVVREAARRRAVRSIALRLAEDAAADAEDTDDILGRHQLALERLIRAGEASHTIPLRKALSDAMVDVDRIVTATSEITGVPTGIPDFDNLTGGLQPGTVTVIAARPRRGKSVLCGQSVTHAAERGHSVLMFSLEMPPRQVARRMLLSAAEVDRYQLRRNEGALQRVQAAEVKLSGLPIWLDDREAPTMGQIRATAKRLKAAQGIDLVVVDYLQRCTVDRQLKRHEAIGELVDGLKSLAMQLNVPVLTACQVGREGEERKPTLADLRESGSIEQTADVVAILHPHPMPGKSPAEVMELEYPQVDLWVEKHRDGAEMCIPLSFEKRVLRFVNIARNRDGA